jgi:hypothetical protein
LRKNVRRIRAVWGNRDPQPRHRIVTLRAFHARAKRHECAGTGSPQWMAPPVHRSIGECSSFTAPAF